MKGYPNWPNKPKSLSERGYRKFMAKQKKVTVNGEEYTLQSVSPTWYFGVNDDCGMTGGGRRDTTKYIDTMLKNVVISPAPRSRPTASATSTKRMTSRPRRS